MNIAARLLLPRLLTISCKPRSALTRPFTFVVEKGPKPQGQENEKEKEREVGEAFGWSNVLLHRVANDSLAPDQGLRDDSSPLLYYTIDLRPNYIAR